MEKHAWSQTTLYFSLILLFSAATTTSQLTTSQNSFVTTPMTTTGQKVPNGVSSKMTPGNTQHPSLSTLPPPAGIEPAQSSHTGSKFVDRLTVFMLGLSAAKKDLLGEILLRHINYPASVGVNSGFLISSWWLEPSGIRSDWVYEIQSPNRCRSWWCCALDR